MGTRALVRIEDGDREILCLYRHHDGYPEGLGKDLSDFCATKTIVNGICSDYQQERIANGMGCFAAQLVAAMKSGVGDVYVYAPGSRDCGEEYEYVIRGTVGSTPTVRAFRVTGYDETRKVAEVER